MAKIRRTPQSEVDYLEIWLYVAPENRTAADHLIESFDEKLELLAEFPRIGRSREKLGPGVRSLLVLHGSRNLRCIFRRRGRRG